jgi:aconitate hydratase
MGKTLTEKILGSHILSGLPKAGEEIGIRIDQTLTQDATGTMAYLQFEAMDITKVQTELSVSYVDHNTIQIDFENADDHRYLQSVARRYGIFFSRPGNGICHQVHLERFGKPGKTLMGSDSHTPTAGALGMFAVGAGGLDVALAMAGEPFWITYPYITRIRLTGQLQPWVSAKDIILKVLSIFSTRGNVNVVFEYDGPGLEKLTVPERATITNMGAECGVTTSIFPSDIMTMRFLRSQGREVDWIELRADPDAFYDKDIEINLSELEPLVAMPHTPDNVRAIRGITPLPIQQVCIGSCTNASYKDLATTAMILRDRIVSPDVSLVVAPGSKQVLENLSRDGYLTNLIAAGARIMENACGFCIGNSQSPVSGGVSLRTSNRNFLGRSGTKDAQVYLASPETACASAIMGRITDPRDLGIPYPIVTVPEKFHLDDRLIIRPENTPDPALVPIERGPNIGVPPANDALPEIICGEITIKVGDKITTDHIIPAGPYMKYRSNIPKYAEFVFHLLDREFPARAKKIRTEGLHNVVVAGLSYGQGSSREHAAICPMYLGIRAVLAKSFERIHMANLINYGILPLVFRRETDYEAFSQGDHIEIPDIRTTVSHGGPIAVHILSSGTVIEMICDLSERQRLTVIAGGALNLKKNKLLEQIK